MVIGVGRGEETVSGIRLGCQTYTWHMAGPRYIGQAAHLLTMAARAGFTGMEVETIFLGDLWQPERLGEALQLNGLELAALTLGGAWRYPHETDEERAAADKVMDLLEHFPQAILALGQVPGQDRSELRERQENLLRCVHAIGHRAHDRGIQTSYHPNSSPGSIARVADDYAVVLTQLNPSIVGYTPDLGHIAKGGMDPLAVVTHYRALITHVHYKDLARDGAWAPMGEGVIDFRGITRYLRDSGYRGWIIVEDECPQAVEDPDQVALRDGVYLKEHLRPLVAGR
jgi:inosose dehydratase